MESALTPTMPSPNKAVDNQISAATPGGLEK